MKIIQGKLDYSAKEWPENSVYIFTGNNTIKKNGALVMGRGAALQCRDAFRGIDKKIGEAISSNKRDIYGLIFTNTEKGILGTLQVKKHYASKAELSIIKHSIRILNGVASQASHLSFHMNFPGIGAGQLKYEDVLPIVSMLPDNVILYI